MATKYQVQFYWTCRKKPLLFGSDKFYNEDRVSVLSEKEYNKIAESFEGLSHYICRKLGPITKDIVEADFEVIDSFKEKSGLGAFLGGFIAGQVSQSTPQAPQHVAHSTHMPTPPHPTAQHTGLLHKTPEHKSSGLLHKTAEHKSTGLLHSSTSSTHKSGGGLFSAAKSVAKAKPAKKSGGLFSAAAKSAGRGLLGRKKR